MVSRFSTHINTFVLTVKVLLRVLAVSSQSCRPHFDLQSAVILWRRTWPPAQSNWWLSSAVAAASLTGSGSWSLVDVCERLRNTMQFVVGDEMSASVLDQCSYWWLPVSWNTPVSSDQSDYFYKLSKPTFFYVHIKLYFFNCTWMLHRDDDDDDDGCLHW